MNHTVLWDKLLTKKGMGALPKPEMSGDVHTPPRSEGRRYEAVLRLSEALSVCREPEDLTKILSERLREFLDFLQFSIVLYKENSTEVEWAVLGQEKSRVAAYADVPVEQLTRLLVTIIYKTPSCLKVHFKLWRDKRVEHMPAGPSEARA